MPLIALHGEPLDGQTREVEWNADLELLTVYNFPEPKEPEIPQFVDWDKPITIDSYRIKILRYRQHPRQKYHYYYESSS